MSITEELKDVIQYYLNSDLNKYDNLYRLFQSATNIREEDKQQAISIAKKVRSHAMKNVSKDVRFYNLYNDALLFLAPDDLDSYILYIEKDRPPQERFYLPRRKTLKQIVDAIQDLADNKLDELFIHLPGRVGKTQICTFAFCWWVCRDTERSNLYCSYADAVATGFYNGVLEILTDPTYCHADVFPDAKIVQTNSQDHTIDLKRKKKYKSITAKGLTAGLNGQCDCDGLLMGDDLIEGIQDALSPDILARKQAIVDNNLIPRAKMQAKKIWCGTIWSLKDPYSNRINFLTNDQNAKHIRYKIIKIPALDENDESNFDYLYGVGFSTQHYRQIRAKFESEDDIASWMAQYQQSPIERMGAVFDPNFMNFYNGILPNCDPDYKIGVCDVALGGSDYLAFVVAYVYQFDTGQEVYITYVVFSSEDKKVTRPLVRDMILKHKIDRALFEANNGGELYREDIEEMLKNRGYRLNIRSRFAPTNTRKQNRIYDKAPEIREFYFLENGMRSKDYIKFMQNVFSFTMFGKNKHDDAPDALAILASEVNGTWNPVRTMKRSSLPI